MSREWKNTQGGLNVSVNIERFDTQSKICKKTLHSFGIARDGVFNGDIPVKLESIDIFNQNKGSNASLYINIYVAGPPKYTSFECSDFLCIFD